MECIEVTPGPTLDWLTTSGRLHARILAQIKKHNADFEHVNNNLIDEDGSLDVGVIEAMHQAVKAKWWHPTSYIRGLTSAMEWVNEDAENERQMVYYVGHRVTIETRVRRTTVFAPPPRRRGLSPPRGRGASVSSIHSVLRSPSVSAKAPTEDTESDLDFDMGAMLAAIPDRQATLKSQYDVWISSLPFRAVCDLLRDHSFTTPQYITAELERMIYTASASYLSENFPPNLIDRVRTYVSQECFRARVPMGVADLSAIETSEALAM
jgi:hypothetical protein